MVERKKGTTAAEFMMATVILGLAIVPIFGIFGTSKTNVFKSKISYMAVHVARERLEELRQVPFMMLGNLSDPLAPPAWECAEGNTFKHTIEQRNSRAQPVTTGGSSGATEGSITYDGTTVTEYSAGGGASASLNGEDGNFDYPPEYARIWTKVTVVEVNRRDYASETPGDTDDITSIQAGIKPIRLKQVKIEYYWQEKGEEPDEAKLKNTNRITTIIASHNIE